MNKLIENKENIKSRLDLILEYGDFRQKTISRGELLYSNAERCKQFYIVISGRIKMGNYTESGREIAKEILHEGGIFGELTLINLPDKKEFAMAMEKTTVAVIPIEELKSLLMKHPKLYLFIIESIGKRLIQMEHRVESLVFKKSRTRIIEFLQRLVEKTGQQVGYEMVVWKFLPHREIANLTSTSRQTVTTVLNELKTKNILTFSRRRLLVRDIHQLALEAS